MKVMTLIALSTLLVGSGNAVATGQQEHDLHNPDAAGAGSREGLEMRGNDDTSMMPMHEHMQKMRSQMAEIHRTEDPDRRNSLIEAHMESMRDMMKMMQEMHQGKSMMGQSSMMGKGMAMQGGKMMGGQMEGKNPAPQAGMSGDQPAGMMEMMHRQKMMDQRMDMMQMMMDQMIQNQAARDGTRKIQTRGHDHRKIHK